MRLNARKHGMRYSRIYRIYENMKQRCYNPNNEKYKNYGGRGIKICDEWLNDFMSFYTWGMENGYADNLSIDRIDVNGDYCPENCRFANEKVQSRNRQNNVYVDYEGRKMTLAEAAERTKINYMVLQTRHKKGDRGKRLFRSVKKKQQRKSAE